MQVIDQKSKSSTQVIDKEKKMQVIKEKKDASHQQKMQIINQTQMEAIDQTKRASHRCKLSVKKKMQVI